MKYFPVETYSPEEESLISILGRDKVKHIESIEEIHKTKYLIYLADGSIFYSKIMNPHMFDASVEERKSHVFTPATVIYQKENCTVLSIHHDFINYNNIHDIINKRESFVSSMNSIHTSGNALNKFDIVEKIDSLVSIVENTDIKDPEIEEITRIYDKILRPVAIKLNSNLVKPSFCNNDLFLHDIYHNGQGDVKILDWSCAGLNDYAWDYACILSRGYDNLNYVSILNNNALLSHIQEKYKDDHVRIRIIMSMVLVDLLDLLKIYITDNRKENKRYSNYFDTGLHGSRILKQRILSLVYQSSTTIDYFHYIYKWKS